MTKFRLICAAAIMLAATGTAAFATTFTLDFDNDPIAGGLSTLTSVDSPLVTFSSTDASGVVAVTTIASATANPQLATAANVPAGLRMEFSVLVDSLSMLFGNDDPNFAEDRAILSVFNNGTKLGETVLIYNKNDLADQTISISGLGGFDAATLFYADATGAPVSVLAEVVDNVTFNTVAPVPLPAAGWMLVVALGGMAVMRRRTGS
ncbi:MAG: VPLPA-CTERM sorting domain-containing protein [Pseudomonadota bacterium]